MLAGVHSDTQVVGDSAFLDLERQQELKALYQVHLLTPLNSNMHPTPERHPFILPVRTRPIRRLTETVYAQLVERFHVLCFHPTAIPRRSPRLYYNFYNLSLDY